MKRTPLQSVAIYVAAAVLAMVTLAPVVWLFLMSIMEPREISTIPLRWIPQNHPDFSQYAALIGLNGALQRNPFLSALRNSLVAATGSTLLALAAATLAAYAISRRGSPQLILTLMLATFMMPPIAYVLPLYGMFSGFGLLNNPLALVITYCSLLLPFATWLLKANLDKLPAEVDEAAAIDGAGTWMTLTRIVLPMARPALLAAGMLCFLISWDEFFYALIFMNDQRGKTLPVTIADFAAGRVTNFALISAVGVLAALPPLLLALFFRKNLVSGLSAGSIKG